MNNLLVITEVDYLIESNTFRNSSVNIIFSEYAKHFDNVIIYCPGKESRDELQFRDNIFVYTNAIYSKKLMDRVANTFSIVERKRINSILDKHKIVHVQVRIPSVFSFVSFFTLKNLSRSYYVAGDWFTSFSANFNFPGSRIIGYLLRKISLYQIGKSKVVTAGPVLAEIYSKYTPEVHAYLSTTHDSYTDTLDIKIWNKICCVGRLEPLKRVEDVIQAVSILNNTWDLENKYYLEICGDGKLRNRLKELVKKLNLESCVVFHGNISSRRKLENIYSQSGYMVLASVSEGTPKVIPESMSFGCIPIAVKGVGSIDNIIENNVNGITVNECSPEEIALAISNLNSNLEYRCSLTEAGKKYSLEHTISNEVNNLWRFINEKC